MMTYLTYNGELRTETETEIIANLLRKGWVEAPQPDYNATTHKATFTNGEWQITPLTLPPITVTKRSLLLKMSAEQQQTLDEGISSLPEGEDKRNAFIYYTNSTTVARTHPMVAFFGSLLNLDSAEMDALFALAKEQDILEESYLT